MIGKKVLLIDDDRDFLALAVRIFERSGAKTITALDGLEGMGKLLTHNPDLIIMDIMLPGMDGFQVCQRIRQFSNTPLMMLSALDKDQLMLQGLEAGADDFLSKPVNPDILLARAQAVIRRNRQKNGQPSVYSYDDGHLVIDFEKHSVQIESHEIKLTPFEFRLLAYLASNADKVLSFEQILFNVWGSEYDGKDDYVHVYVSHLRSKIEQDPRNPCYIVTVFGVGYIFERQNSARTFAGRITEKQLTVK